MLFRSKTPVVLFLSGRRRGRLEKLEEDTLRVVRAADSYVRFLAPEHEDAHEYHATLHRAGTSYEIEVKPGHEVWVNGERVDESHLLKSGDLLEIGHAGPVLRYRLYLRGATPRKSVADALADSFNGARADGRTRWGKSARFVANVARDLATQTSLWFRIWVLVLLTALVVSVALLVAQGLRLQKRVALEGVRIESIAEVLEKTGTEMMTREELLALQQETEARLAAAIQRLEALEARADVVARVIAAASPSVAFIQGSFGFFEPQTGKPLRYVKSPEGLMLFTLEGDSNIVELSFTGTGFVVSEDGLLMTNRHVAEPWSEGEHAEMAAHYGLKPVIQRLLAFLPGVREPLALELVRIADEVDLALLKTRQPIAGVPALKLDPQPPRPGEEIVVLGYPLGMQALVVRASPAFLEKITPEGDADFWAVARRLSDAGYIKPLASRGIVSQVSEDVIVYDAETAIGGSGGPVLDLSGRVVAVNEAVIAEFGGSNMGVPARQAQRLLAMPPAAAADK